MQQPIECLQINYIENFFYQKFSNLFSRSFYDSKISYPNRLVISSILFIKIQCKDKTLCCKTLFANSPCSFVGNKEGHPICLLQTKTAEYGLINVGNEENYCKLPISLPFFIHTTDKKRTTYTIKIQKYHLFLIASTSPAKS